MQVVCGVAHTFWGWGRQSPSYKSTPLCTWTLCYRRDSSVPAGTASIRSLSRDQSEAHLDHRVGRRASQGLATARRGRSRDHCRARHEKHGLAEENRGSRIHTHPSSILIEVHRNKQRHLLFVCKKHVFFVIRKRKIN